MANKIPKGALRFVGAGQTACAFAADDGKERIQMTVYTGGVIENHWWWDNLIMDLEGVKFRQKVYPILENHETDRKVGFHQKPIVTADGGIQLDPEKSGFVDTPHSQEFRKLSKEGFPYQASLYGKPSKIQRFGEDEEVVVNGHKVKGPGTVWREWEYKESSVCVFGWDSKTKSSAFSRDEEEEVDYLEEGGEETLTLDEEGDTNKNSEGGENIMDLKEFKTKHPDLFSQVIEEGKSLGRQEAESQFSDERKSFQEQIDSMNSKFSETEERTAKMEKELTLSREEAMKSRADKLFAEIFADSDVEPRLESKVRNQINHSKFVKEDRLDEEAFSKAVQDEIADWESRMAPTDVRGFSSSGDEAGEGSDQLSEENKSVVSDMLSRAGQTAK